MIHIVFQQADVDVLRKSFALDDTLEGEILEIKDDYAVGPLKNIYTEEGIQNRLQWWREVLAGGDYEGSADNGSIDDNQTVKILVERLENNQEEIVWIWAAQNKHDVSGYYWLVSQLKKFQGRIFILYLNNLPFINEKGNIFYPANIYEIQPREFLKAKKLARVISGAEFELDPEEWEKICEADKGVRILEGGKKLQQYDESFYDKELLKFIGSDWIRTSKLIHQFLSKGAHTTGDAYLLWRLKQLVRAGELDAQGEMKNMKDFDVKSKVLQGLATH